MANPKELPEVRELFGREKHAIIARYGAHGAGIGRSADTTRYEIVVYLDRETPLPSATVVIEGVELRFEHRERASALT